MNHKYNPLMKENLDLVSVYSGATVGVGTAEGQLLYWDDTAGVWTYNQYAIWNDATQTFTLTGQQYIVDTANPQLNLVHTATTFETSMQTDSNGYLNIIPSGNRVVLTTNTDLYFGTIWLENFGGHFRTNSPYLQTGGNCYFGLEIASPDTFASFHKAGITFPRNITGPIELKQVQHTSDAATSDMELTAQTALAAASTNITGGDITLTAGDGASASAGAADGGDIILSGGTGYGTGSNGSAVVESALKLKDEQVFQSDSSTQLRDTAKIQQGWINSTDAARTGYIDLVSTGFGGDHIGLRIEDNGTYARAIIADVLSVHKISTTMYIAPEVSTTLLQTSLTNTRTTFSIQGNGTQNARFQTIYGNDAAAYFRIEQLAASTQIYYGTSIDYIYFNVDKRDIDHVFRGATDNSLLHLDAANDTAQIGSATAADSSKFYVNGKISCSGEAEINGDLNHDGSNIGFFGTAPIAKPAITGAKGGNAALASLLTQLAALGLVTDSTT